jgi:hypothetical protein
MDSVWIEKILENIHDREPLLYGSGRKEGFYAHQLSHETSAKSKKMQKN